MRASSLLRMMHSVMMTFHEGWAVVTLAADFFAGVFLTVDALEVLGALAAEEVGALEDIVDA